MFHVSEYHNIASLKICTAPCLCNEVDWFRSVLRENNFVHAAGIAAELIANHPNSTFYRKLHGNTTEELAFESTEVGLEVVEQMIVWLEQAIDSWEANAETANDLTARLYELRLVSQLRSLETLRDPQFDASLPERYRNIVSTFWTCVRDQKMRLESRME